MSERNLEDRAAIHDLFTRYCCALDNGEIETVVDCFTVDGSSRARSSTSAATTKSVPSPARFAAQHTAGTQFRHMVSNIAMTITGNRAAASAYLLVLISKDGDHRSLPPGRYACELIKEDAPPAPWNGKPSRRKRGRRPDPMPHTPGISGDTALQLTSPWARNRKFESISLQRRIHCELSCRKRGRKRPPGSEQ